MISGHGVNPIFFNKKNKHWTSRTLANPQPLQVRHYLIFTLPPSPPLALPPSLKWMSYVYHPLAHIFSLTMSASFPHKARAKSLLIIYIYTTIKDKSIPELT